MSAAAVEEWSPSPVLRNLGFKDRACQMCGWRFFTTAALYEHETTCGQPEEAPQSVYRWTEAGLAVLREVGRQNGSIRRRCDACGMESNAPAIGRHQKLSGHAGWTEA